MEIFKIILIKFLQTDIDSIEVNTDENRSWSKGNIGFIVSMQNMYTQYWATDGVKVLCVCTV